MNILLVNKFLYPKGGDAICTLDTGKLLSQKGHQVFYWGMDHPDNPLYPYKEHFVSYVDYNKHMNMLKKLRAASKICYSVESKRKFEKIIKITQPDIVHLNNIHLHISPSILDVLKKRNIPVIMTLHDYKVVCPYYYLMRMGMPCEKCKGGKYYFCFLGKCTKGSYSKSLVNTIEMYIHHKILHIFDKVNLFISPSKFLMNKVKEMGFNKEIVYLPNFISTEAWQPKYQPTEKTIVYFGRLSDEKGLFTLLEAIKDMDVQLKIIGDGPLRTQLKKKTVVEKISNVVFTGYKKSEELKREIQNSMATVIPSHWYENYPRSILESFAMGKPVVGAKIGGIPELIEDGVTGFAFEPGNAEDLRDKIEYMLSHKNKVIEMGKNARKLVEEKYNPEIHYDELIRIYRECAIAKNNF